jgi:hypothetical protein
MAAEREIGWLAQALEIAWFVLSVWAATSFLRWAGCS